jgi:hypothetical protein
MSSIHQELHNGFLDCVRNLNIIYKNLDTNSEYSMVYIREPIHIIKMTTKNEITKVLLEAPNANVEESIMRQIELSFPFDVIRKKIRNGYMYCFSDSD